MAYRLTYRGEFDNTLPGVDNAAIVQTVRIDIANTKSGLISATTVTSNANMGFGSTSFQMVANGTGATYPDLVAFFTAGTGKFIRVSGTGGAADGDYIIVSDPLFTAPVISPASYGYVQFSLNRIPLSDVPPGTDGITVEDITAGSVVPLKMAGDPLHIAVIDNADDKFTPIRAKQAVINIHTDDVIDINTFAEADDGSFYVEIFVDLLIIFRGYLIIPDMSQEFMPNPNELILIAVDNLGTLKDILLVDQDGITPLLNNQIIKYVSWCLRQTAILQPVNIINSVRHGGGAVTMTITFTYSGDMTVFTAVNSDAAKLTIGQFITITGSVSNNITVTITDIQTIDPFIKKIVTNGTFTAEGPVAITINDTTSLVPFYQACFLDAKTFEKDINICENCYSVLKKILGEDSVLFQQNGEWYIVRIDDMQGDGTYSVDRFDSTGEYIETVTIDRNKNIGKPDIMQLMNDDPLLIPDRGYKKIVETFRYETPIEIICYIDFRGQYVSDLVLTAGETADGVNFSRRYTNEGWTLKRDWPIPSGAPALDSEAYVKRLYNVVDYEVSRMVLLTAPATTDVRAPYIESCALDVNRSDRFEASVDYKLASNITTGGGFYHLLVFVLHGSDDTWWILNISEQNGGQGGDTAAWLNTNGWTTFTGKGEFGLNFSIGTDYSVVQSLTYDFKDVPPLPIGGKLYVWMFGLNTNGSYDVVDINYSGLSFTYYPFINGSYKKYTGQSHTVSQTGDYRAARDEQVYISDAPALLLKGGLRVFNGIDFVLTTVFTDANHSEGRPFGELQAYAVWNQYRKSNRNFDGEVDLMESEVVDTGLYNGADLLHKYKMTDVNVNTVNRLFMVLHYDMDFYLLEWKAFIASLYRTDLGKVYTDPHVFLYISS